MNKCAETVRSVVVGMRHEFLTAGFFGSQEDDLDVLVVMTAPPLDVYERLCSALREALPGIACCPTFRLQEFVMPESADDRMHRLHLLAFPSIEVFNQVERPFVRYCIAKTYRPFVGDAESLLRGNRNRPAQNLSFYENLLFETAQLYFMGSMPEETLIREVRKKLLYIVKFALLEAFYRPEGPIDLYRITSTLFNSAIHDLCKEGGEVYSRLMNWARPSEREIRDAFRDVAALVGKLRSKMEVVTG
jgi:hypothetical protein